MGYHVYQRLQFPADDFICEMIDIWLLFNLTVPFVEVFLQTYIEHIRGNLEDKKEMNHHGKTVVVDNFVPAEEEANIRSVNERVQRDSLKKMYERKEKFINEKKLGRALFMAHTLNPILIACFVVMYWIVGLNAYSATHEQ